MMAHNSLRSLLTVYSLSEPYLCGSGFHPVRNVRISSGLTLVVPAGDEDASAIGEDPNADEEAAEGCECEGLALRWGGRCPRNGPCPWPYDAEVRPGQYAEGPLGCSLSFLKRSYSAGRARTASAVFSAAFARRWVDV